MTDNPYRLTYTRALHCEKKTAHNWLQVVASRPQRWKEHVAITWRWQPLSRCLQGCAPDISSIVPKYQKRTIVKHRNVKTHSIVPEHSALHTPTKGDVLCSQSKRRRASQDHDCFVFWMVSTGEMRGDRWRAMRERQMGAYLVKYHDRAFEVDTHDLAYAGVNNIVVRAGKKYTSRQRHMHQRRHGTRMGGCWSRAPR